MAVDLPKFKPTGIPHYFQCKSLHYTLCVLWSKFLFRWYTQEQTPCWGLTHSGQIEGSDDQSLTSSEFFHKYHKLYLHCVYTCTHIYSTYIYICIFLCIYWYVYVYFVPYQYKYLLHHWRSLFQPSPREGSPFTKVHPGVKGGKIHAFGRQWCGLGLCPFGGLKAPQTPAEEKHVETAQMFIVFF